MSKTNLYLFAADAILLVHVLFVLFVVIGLLLVLVGGFCRWRWVRHWWFRVLHLAAIGVVVVQSWFGVICPLTDIEMALRSRGGDAVYVGSFVSHWLDSLLYYRAPQWLFMVVYTLFGALVIASWFIVRPDPRKKESV
jgi:Protein of Unknown function (DUF2784)